MLNLKEQYSRRTPPHILPTIVSLTALANRLRALYCKEAILSILTIAVVLQNHVVIRHVRASKAHSWIVYFMQLSVTPIVGTKHFIAL